MKIKCTKCNKNFDYKKNHGICIYCGIYNKLDYDLKDINLKQELQNNTSKFFKENYLKIFLLILSLFLPLVAFFFSITQIIN